MNSEESGPPLCSKCSTFYGTAENGGLCSTCFKDNSGGAQQQKMSVPDVSLPTTQAISAGSALAASSAAVSAEASDSNKDAKGEQSQLEEETKRVQKRKDRCFLKGCKTKISLIQQQTNMCQCGFIFCDKHRLAESHDCDFDHQQRGKSQLEAKLVATDKSRGRTVHRMDSS
eukprot:m.21046 g.21046  ORF g.21046 m.21046 type:complete len:172 (-) comp7016_c0_seq2:80-595(-)